MTRRQWFATAVVALWPALGHAQPCTGGRPNDVCEALGPAAALADGMAAARGASKPSGPDAKVAASLRALISAGTRGGVVNGAAAGTADLARVDRAGELHVYVELVEFRAEHLTRLAHHGFRLEASLPEFRLVQGWLPPGAVAAVAALDIVKAVRPPDYPVRNSVGTASTEGDAILRADLARAAFGVSGAGVKVGVISDGVDFLVDSQNSGDLPFVEVLFAGGGNEGTAMLEIVHDVAPGAALAFWGPGTSVEMVQGINALRDAGARVVVDDLSFFSEPKFQDGMIAQTIRAFARNGRAYAGSAGNRAKQHYRANYSRLFGEAFPSPEYVAVHNYEPGGADPGNTLDIPSGCSLSVHLQWNNPWGAARDDFDLAIGRTADGAVLAVSDDPQDGSQNPFESTSWTNHTGVTVTVFIAVAEWALVSPPGSLVLDYFAIPACGDELQYVTAEQSLSGNHAVSEMFSVAAVGATAPTAAEDYSSRGPHDVHFPAFERRFVPNVSAVDCVQTRTGQLGHFSNPFCGTSAAAPHVAGALALLVQASPALDSQQIRALVLGTALDLGEPGFDLTYGTGRIDAVNAVTSSPLPPFAFIQSNGVSFSAGETILLTLTAANPPGNPPLDLYVGSLWPDGNSIAFLSGQGFGIGQFNAPASVQPIGTVLGGFAVSGAPLLAFTFPAGGIPAGTYYVFASLFRQGSLGDSALDPGDLIGLSYFPVFYSP